MTARPALAGAIVALAFVSAGCPPSDEPSVRAPHTSSTTPPPPTRTPAIASATATTAAVPSATVAASSLPEGSDCASDADCTVTFNAGGCCLAYCEGYPVTIAEAKRRDAARTDCPPPTTCPPPAPCEYRGYRVQARCKDGRCVGVRIPRDAR